MALLGCLVALLMSGQAGTAVRPGATPLAVTDGSPDYPYQRWVNHSRMPTVSTELLVHEGLCPTNPEADACADVEAETIYLVPARISDSPRWVVLHELGHFWDYRQLNDRERAAFARMEGGESWVSADVEGRLPRPPMMERFASAYAWCAVLNPQWRSDRFRSRCQAIRQWGD